MTIGELIEKLEAFDPEQDGRGRCLCNKVGSHPCLSLEVGKENG